MKWLPWLVFAIFGYFLLSNNFNAELGMIDDHEIAFFLGNDGQVKVNEIVPTILTQTEVGQWGSYLRYRPSYYTLRVIEASLWRDNSFLWYLSRYLMLVVSLWLSFKILSTYFPKIVSYLFVFYAMTMPFWPDLLTRLGPSEIYTVPAVLLFVYGMIKNKWWMITAGYAICVGSKENFVVMFPLLLAWAGSRAYAKKLTKSELIATILLTLYTGFIVGAILVATAKAGTDIYGTQVSYRYRITRFIWDIPKIILNRHLIPSLSVMVVGTMLGMKKQVGLMLIILALISSQYIFYVNLLPSNMRYDFPALLLFPVLDLVAMSTIITHFAKHKYSQIIKLAVYSIMLLIFLFYIFHRGYTLVHRQAVKNSLETNGFVNQLQQAVETIRVNPSATIIFVSERYIDFEPIVSVARFLTAKGIVSQFQLYYNPPKTNADPMELDDRLKQVMNGDLGTDKVFDRFSKFGEDNDPCYSLTFGSALPLTDCPEIARF